MTESDESNPFAEFDALGIRYPGERRHLPATMEQAQARELVALKVSQGVVVTAEDLAAAGLPVEWADHPGGVPAEVRSNIIDFASERSKRQLSGSESEST